MTRSETIRDRLGRQFAPEELRVEDQSARHAGHAGARPEGETHFHVHIVSAQFAGLSRVERQRRIYAALAGEFDTGLHALTLTALTPQEQAKA